jgi:hypothetical protein
MLSQETNQVQIRPSKSFDTNPPSREYQEIVKGNGVFKFKRKAYNHLNGKKYFYEGRFNVPIQEQVEAKAKYELVLLDEIMTYNPIKYNKQEELDIDDWTHHVRGCIAASRRLMMEVISLRSNKSQESKSYVPPPNF